jgi:hypothetical protein
MSPTRMMRAAKRRLDDLLEEIGSNHPTEEEAELIDQLREEIDRARDYLDQAHDSDRKTW